MNKTELRMVELLTECRERYGVVSVKAEFEAEGTRVDELLRLLDIAARARMPLTLKIGGCEAIRDLFEAKQFGARYIVAPMVETAYALSKFVAAKELVFGDDVEGGTGFLCNVETITSYENRDSIIESAAQRPGLEGVVFGRSDFIGSRGQQWQDVNDARVTDCVVDIATLCAQRGLDVVVGGGVSIDSIPALRRIRDVRLTRFETRKVVFGADALDIPGIEDGLIDALRFELLWLRNKADYYDRITHEDEVRINTLKRRWTSLDE